MIYVESKKKSKKTLSEKYPNAKIIDITSKGDKPWVKVSPFYPHGEIPIPFSSNCFAMSVEGIWQGLKVFEYEGIDMSKFEVKDMKGLKRTVRKFGKPRGHQKGIHSTELLDYLTARREIYLRTYGWVLDNKANDVIQLLKAEAERQDLVFLDYNTNEDIENSQKPLSHAALVKRYLEKKYPELKSLTFEETDTITVVKGENKKQTKDKIVRKNEKQKGRRKNKKNISNDNQLELFE
jgi:hypothetical protein